MDGWMIELVGTRTLYDISSPKHTDVICFSC